MGWSKRGNGKSYDSLNGYGAIIGFLSQKVLDYTTRNRKCSSCDKGHSPDNYTGRAKGMEPDAAAQLVNNSEVLRRVGLDVRVLVGDDDSSTIDKIMKGSLHKIFKLSCRVHLARNYVKGLYHLKKSYSELGRQGVIGHLKKCFSYALAQNVGNAENLCNTILTIRDHVYDKHDNCGSWCRCSETRKPTVVLTDPNLYTALYEHLLKYANNASKFTVNATTQNNENLNGIISHTMRKDHSLSLTASADFRVAAGVLTKNEGESHLMIMEDKLAIPNGDITREFALRQDEIRREKKKRIEMKKNKTSSHRVKKTKRKFKEKK